MTAAHQHPTDDALAKYGLGTLDDAASTVIDRHLTVCDDCRRRVAEVSGDGFLDRLQSAVGPGGSRAFDDQGPTGTAVQGDTDGPPVVPGAAADILARLRSLPQYENVRPLGQGGMGAVFLARNVSFKRDEVLKVVIPARIGSADAMARFQQEIEAIGQLNHPNVVTPYATHRVGDLLVLSMEFAGDSLDGHLAKTGPLPIQDACRFVAQAADGLQHAFERGVVHRDIKPSNLLLTTVGGKPVVKIVDFGLAKARDESRGGDESRPLTGENVVMGTLAYMSPEQARDSKSADIRTDIYALGCTLYALLTGRPPFVADSPTGFLMAHAQDAPPRLDAQRPDVPPKLADIALKMIAKAPADRHQTPAEVALALEPFATGGTTVDWVPPPEPTRGGWKKPAAVAAAVLAGLAAAVIAASTLFVKTKDGTIELTDLAPDAEVFVDDGKVSVKWADGNQSAEIRVPAGTRKLEVKRNGVTVAGETVEIAHNDRKVVSAKLKPVEPAVAAATPVVPTVDDEDDDPPPPPPVVSAPPEKDFVPLFNGKDLSGWERLGNQDGTSWKVADGILFGAMKTKPPAMPTTLRKLRPMPRHYHLRVKVAGPVGPGALLYLYSEGPRNLHGPGGLYRITLGSTDPATAYVGRLIAPGNPRAKLDVKAERRQWYTLDVIVRGNRITVDVDGKRTADHTDPDMPARPGDLKVHVSAGTTVRFQTIEMKELPDPNAPPKPPEFKALFNGKDLTGWETSGMGQGSWRVEDGVLVGSFLKNAGGTILAWPKGLAPRHYHLRLVTKKSDGWAGIVALFCDMKYTANNKNPGAWPWGGPGPGRYIVFTGCTTPQPDREVGRLEYATGKTRAAAPLLGGPLPVANTEWYTLDVIVSGPRVTVDVNGKRTADYTDPDLPADGRPFTLGCPGNATVMFKSVEFKELPAPAPPKEPEFKSLFNGKDLEGWQVVGNPKANWAVKDGAIVGEWPKGVDSSGGTNIVPVGVKPRHFHLRFEATKSEVWNSRVFLFGSPPNRPPYRIMLGSPQNAVGDEMGRLSARGSDLPMKTPADRIPLRAWNSYDVVVLGNRITVEVNGVRTADLTDDQMPADGGGIAFHCAGHDRIRYRNIEIKELPAPK
jgi:anti-sigma factor RsiW